MSEVYKEPEVREWSVLVYMAADSPVTEMERAAVYNLSQLNNIGSNSSVYVAAQADLRCQPTRRFIFTDKSGQDPVAIDEPVEILDNVNSGDPETVREFFIWATKNCPAKNILLIIWGHGFGLDDFDPFLPDEPAPLLLPILHEAEAVTPKFERIPAVLGTVLKDITSYQIFGLGSDDTSQSQISNSQLAKVLSDCAQQLPLGQKLAILGLDCCEMALLEVWFELAASVPLGVSSQYGIPYKGWPYDVFLKRLIEKSSMTPVQVCESIVKSFADHYDCDDDDTVATLSACDLTKTDPLADSVRSLAGELIKTSESTGGRYRIFKARDASPIFDQDGYIDLEGFCRQLQFNFPSSPEIIKASEAVCLAIREYVLISKFAPKSTTKNISLSTGASVWFPPWIQYPDIQTLQKANSENYFKWGYSQTLFARQTDWHQFLNSLLRNTRKASESEEVVSQDNQKGQKGHVPQLGRIPPLGRTPQPGRTTPGGRVFLDGSLREAGVVVRATVEAFGPVGDTELNVTVKWPAGNNVSLPTDREDHDHLLPDGGDANVNKRD